MKEIWSFRTVFFDTAGGSHVPAQELLRGEKVSRPADPTRENSVFDGWFSENTDFADEWDFSITPDGDLILYAKWIISIIPDPDPEPVPEPITTVDISVIPPQTDNVPDITVVKNDLENYSIGQVTWAPDDDPFLPETQYTVSITLLADEDYTFYGLDNALINGNPAIISNNTGSTVTLMLMFEQTSAWLVSGITVKEQPSRLQYDHGETLSLNGLVVTVSYTSGLEEDIPFAEFSANGITASPANGTALSVAAHNGTRITVSRGGFSATTNPLTVNAVPPGSTGITLTVEMITEGAPLPVDNITISRSGTGNPVTFPVTVANPTLYDSGSIRWEVDGVGVYDGQKVTGTGNTFTLNANLSNADHVKYNVIGIHTLRLYVRISGVEFMRNINFIIAP
jgi:uncharacterized repeat protein (TIGR02543 family)